MGRSKVIGGILGIPILAAAVLLIPHRARTQSMPVNPMRISLVRCAAECSPWSGGNCGGGGSLDFTNGTGVGFENTPDARHFSVQFFYHHDATGTAA